MTEPWKPRQPLSPSHPLCPVLPVQRNGPLSWFPYQPANFPKGAPSFVLLISANGMATCAGFPLLAPLAPAPPSLPSSGSWEADLCRLITQVPLFLAADWVHLRGRIPSRTKGGRREVRCYSPAQFLSSSGPVSPHPPLHSPGQALALSFLPVALQAWRC